MPGPILAAFLASGAATLGSQIAGSLFGRGQQQQSGAFFGGFGRPRKKFLGLEETTRSTVVPPDEEDLLTSPILQAYLGSYV